MEQQHKISLFTAILMNINIMVGVGIFLGPPMMAKQAGFSSFLGWPAVALIFLPIVLSISTIAKIFPGAGSFYAYSKNVINHTTGFISGWMYFLGYIGVTALQTLCLYDIISQYISINQTLFNILFISGLSLLSLVNIKLVGRIQNTGTFFKLLPLLFVLAIFVIYLNPNFTITTNSLYNVSYTIPVALFGFWGFEYCCTISHLIKGKKSNASRAILIGFFATMTIYTLFHFGLLHIMGTQNLIEQGTENFVRYLNINSTQLTTIFNLFITASISLAFINTIFSMISTNASTLQAIATDNFLPFSKKLTLQNKQQRPFVAIFTQSLIVIGVTCGITNKSVLLAMVNLGVLVAFLLTLVALFMLQRESKSYKAMIITILAFISLAVLSTFSWLKIGETNSERIIAILPLLGVLLLGIVMFKLQQQKKITRLMQH